MKTLILDNYDSFTYNLYQLVAELGGSPQVHRNDQIGIDDVKKKEFTHIIIGPGPGNPYTARDIGISEQLLHYSVSERIPLFGVCLGHQIIGKYFGGTVKKANEPRHGKVSSVSFKKPKSRIFAGLPSIIEGMRYHSLCIEKVPTSLRVTALASDGVIMAVEHESLPIYGIQFHPESIGTPKGADIMKNFLSIP